MKWSKCIDDQNKHISLKIDKIALELNSLKNLNEIGLFIGLSGISLFNFYYSRYKNISKYSELGYKYILKIFEAINEKSFVHSFSYGLPGIGWLIEHLIEYDFIEEENRNVLEDIDSFIFEDMMKALQTSNYDYLHGGLGNAMYLLNRKNTNTVNNYLHQLVDTLHEKSIKDTNGSIKWVSKPSNNSSESEFTYNISLSHGMSSLLLILCKIYHLKINKRISKKLIRGCVLYILSQKFCSRDFNSFFPSLSKDNSKPKPSRLAWCYGDLGICLAVFKSAEILDDNSLKKEIVNLLQLSTQRKSLKKNGVYDAALCHGANGIAQIYNRMFHYTGIDTFQTSAKYWYNKALSLPYYTKVIENKHVEYSNLTRKYSLLEGASGIGLSLISAISDIEPTWDSCLLLS